MNELKKIKLTIFGKTYSVSTDEKQEDLYQAAELVDSLIKDMASKVNLKDDSRVAIWAALQLAMQLQQSKKELKDFLKKAETLDELLKSEVC